MWSWIGLNFPRFSINLLIINKKVFNSRKLQFMVVFRSGLNGLVMLIFVKKGGQLDLENVIIPSPLLADIIAMGLKLRIKVFSLRLK